MSFTHRAAHRATAVVFGLAGPGNERASLLPKLRSVSLSGKQYAVGYWAGGDKSL